MESIGPAKEKLTSVAGSAGTVPFAVVNFKFVAVESMLSARSSNDSKNSTYQVEPLVMAEPTSGPERGLEAFVVIIGEAVKTAATSLRLKYAASPGAAELERATKNSRPYVPELTAVKVAESTVTVGARL
jgi:hypothetical protein